MDLHVFFLNFIAFALTHPDLPLCRAGQRMKIFITIECVKIHLRCFFSLLARSLRCSTLWRVVVEEVNGRWNVLPMAIIKSTVITAEAVWPPQPSTGERPTISRMPIDCHSFTEYREIGRREAICGSVSQMSCRMKCKHWMSVNVRSLGDDGNVDKKSDLGQMLSDIYILDCSVRTLDNLHGYTENSSHLSLDRNPERFANSTQERNSTGRTQKSETSTFSVATKIHVRARVYNVSEWQKTRTAAEM